MRRRAAAAPGVKPSESGQSVRVRAIRTESGFLLEGRVDVSISLRYRLSPPYPPSALCSFKPFSSCDLVLNRTKRDLVLNFHHATDTEAADCCCTVYAAKDSSRLGYRLEAAPSMLAPCVLLLRRVLLHALQISTPSVTACHSERFVRKGCSSCAPHSNLRCESNRRLCRSLRARRHRTVESGTSCNILQKHRQRNLDQPCCPWCCRH